MAAGKLAYVCQSCGYTTPKWMGKCPDCGQWNSLVEERLEPARSKRRAGGRGSAPLPITKVVSESQSRFVTGIGEFDRILGGGVVPGSLVLVGGDPGIGKSTLLLQMASKLSSNQGQVLYVSGEESAAQTKQRAERLGALGENLWVFTEVNLEHILDYIHNAAPRLAIVDSIQTVYHPELGAAPGSVSQIRECTDRFLRLAKSRDIAFFLIGHVTKSGAIAGPRLLEHMVDTVLYFEGDRHQSFRILRAVKNRFGPTNEIGVFEMGPKGLIEVTNPSKIFLAQRGERVAGSVVVSSLEGTRPLLVELQALVSRSNYSMPQRVVTGVDYQRLVMLLAVLEKKHGMRLGSQDVFVNAAGGIKVDEPAVDLGIVTAIASSYRDRPVDPDTVIVGEVGLGGEVRAVSHPDERVREAQKLGFGRCVISAGNLPALSTGVSLKVSGVKTVREALDQLLESS
jgi:DNA repair protein RadA/Sms